VLSALLLRVYIREIVCGAAWKSLLSSGTAALLLRVYIREILCGAAWKSLLSSGTASKYIMNTIRSSTMQHVNRTYRVVVSSVGNSARELFGTLEMYVIHE